MKPIILLAIVCMFSATTVSAQNSYDTTAPYKKTNVLPQFKILQGDSTWYTNNDLPKNKPIVLIYFSPECGHCQLTAKDLVSKMSKLQDVFFLMISYHTPQQIQEFAKDYKLDHYKNVRLGRDPNYAIPSFYRVKFTPFMAAYDKSGKFVKAWEQGTDADTLIKMFHKQQS